MNAIEMLIVDHKEVENLFQQFETSDNETHQAMIAEQICKMLTVHATIEEELFYPEARNVLKSNDEELVDEAVEEHAEAKEMIAQIKTMTTGQGLDVAVMELKEAIEHHVDEEENDMFVRLQNLGMETVELGKKMSARKQQLMSTVK